VIGLSDHTMNLLTPACAYILGATVFERHFTIDKTLKKSADHWLSADVDDMTKIIENVNLAAEMLGEDIKNSTPSEERARKYARRSIVAAKEIKAGEILTEENLACKRPGTGLSPVFWNVVIGTRATRNLKEDEVLQKKDFDNEEYLKRLGAGRSKLRNNPSEWA